MMIGDKPSDMAAGIAVGATTIWLSFGRDYAIDEPKPDFIANNWSDCLATLRRIAPTRDAA